MIRKYIRLFSFILSLSLLTACNDDDFGYINQEEDGLVKFQVEIDKEDGTRGLIEEQKTKFEEGEVIHIKAVFNCNNQGVKSTQVKYGTIQYMGHSYWTATDGDHQLTWPDDTESAVFYAYYMTGMNGVLTDNTMPAKLMSDFKYDEIPLFDIVADKKYGDAVKLRMKHIFTHMTLTDLQGGIANELWFTANPSDPADKSANPKRRPLNNAFRLVFDPTMQDIIPEFTQIPDMNYPDENGKPGLVYIKSTLQDVQVDGEVSSGMGFFLEPAVYHDFTVLYPKNRTSYSTYLAYSRDLSKVPGAEELLPNHRYFFSVLKSLGVILKETPDNGWDKSDPTVIVDVESFLRAANSGSEYFEKDPKTGEDVQILESTLEGSRLVRNVDFQYKYYDIFTERGYFKPSISNTFDGNFHYIYNMGCPLFYENNGVITNLGIRNASTKNRPVISNERLPRGNTLEDFSYNGFIASRNYGTVVNVRVVNADMTVQVQTSSPDDRTTEAHNVSLLFGVNRGNVYDIGLSGTLKLTVENASGETIIPRVMIGGLAGQNLGIVSGINYIAEDGFETPDLTIVNKLNGENGVYKIGPAAGVNTGTLDDIFIASMKVDSKSSRGLGSTIGGIVGENSASTSGAAMISSCIVRGEVSAGTVNQVRTLSAVSYAGGIAGAHNTQANVIGCSVTVGVEGSKNVDPNVDYGEGGAFGIIEKSLGTSEGKVETLSCYGTKLTGNNSASDHIGNFAGISTVGFDWNHYASNGIRIKNFNYSNIGIVR